MLDTAQQNHVIRSRSADDTDELPHPGDLEGHASAGAAIEPALPGRSDILVGVGIGLVEEIEGDGAIPPIGSRHLTPEGDGVVFIRHGLLPCNLRLARCAPVQDQRITTSP